jgi:hypothetical protein
MIEGVIMGYRSWGAAGAAFALGAITLLPVAASASGPGGADQNKPFEVSVVSSRADMVSGGDALVEITTPGSSGDNVRVLANGDDVTSVFSPGPAGTLLGLVEGLGDGANQVSVTVGPADSSNARARANAPSQASVEIVNHPVTGPVFSGPHIPMYCSAGGPPWNLGSTDANCHVDGVSVSYEYRTTGGSFAPLADPSGPLPGDVAMTTTTLGDVVPYVVRIERGTINRAVYETAILHDPAGEMPSPWVDTPGWNERLVYTFGGGCGIGYHQGSGTGGVLNDTLLRQGYAVASATFNVYQQNCNDVTSAETATMVKEHFIETYGVPEFTMGWGSSAGTMQQLLISNAYPGILDGVIGEIGYPDERSTTVSGHECRFIRGAFAALDGTPLAFDGDQRVAVEGFAPATMPGFPFTCFGYQFFDNVDWPTVCPGQIPPADRYDPVTNPGGIRCAIADFVSNVYGTDPNTGFGRPLVPDTVGVQYGLRALNDGVISTEQFLELNRLIGGIDIDGNPTAERSEADPIALERAYATGRVNQFDGGLRWTPIIETRRYRDFNADFHDKQRSWSMRARLLRATGDAFNHVSWNGDPAYSDEMRERALAEMDAWLTARTALQESQPDLDPVELTRMSKPDLSDGCIDPGDGSWIYEPLTLDPAATCNQFYPYHDNPRIAAGGPEANDIVKCRLTAPDRGAYNAAFTDEQWDDLVGIFDQGVCDWTKPGVGQVPLEGLWIRF